MRVAYWINRQVVVAVGPWENMRVEGVLWVEIGNHRMQGADNYWVHGNYYGGFTDPENHYGGFRMTRWQLDPHKRVKRELPPPEAHVIRGVLIPDDDARELGLI